ncbi:MAG: rod-binding protein [Spirochaetaceae bacterium]|jgi:flagellar protein FlgJ|nr:rod-binding protein [Spirochaetaceae bacterium]
MDLGAIGSYQIPDIQINTGFSGTGWSPPAGGKAVSSQESFSEALEKELRRQGGETRPVSSDGKALVDKTSKLYETCLELEGFLVKTLISGMRSTVQKSGLIDEGFAGKMYEDMLYDEYAREFTRNAGFGLADMAYLELTGQRGKAMVR